MIPNLAPGFLTWDEVDPARHPFDSASATQAVRSLRPARCVPSRPDVSIVDPAMNAWSWDVARPWADAMSHALVERYGRWAVGWRWSHGEGDFDGGPVGNWCCMRDSVTTPEETLARVVAALREWREWVESLAGWYEAYPLDLGSVADQRVLWERAARNLIQHVVDRTGCESGWYGHCHQVLTWFLSRWGVAPDVAQQMVKQAIGGRFESWTGPDTVLIEDVVEQLALAIRPDAGAPLVAAGVPDHLQRWLEVREAVPWHEAPDRGVQASAAPSRDGAAEDIRAFDGAIDSARADGLLAALELVRLDAARGAPRSTSNCCAAGSSTSSAYSSRRRSAAFRPSPRAAANATASARTPVPASTPASPEARRPTRGRLLSPRVPHGPTSTSASSIPSTTATPDPPSWPCSSSSPAKATHSTASVCFAGSPFRRTTPKTR